MGSGTVYNIVYEWSNKFGIEKANVLRELAVKLKKNGLTVSDCAKGFRMLMIFCNIFGSIIHNTFHELS
jgi:hypothetical protein